MGWGSAVRYLFIFFFNDTATTEIYTLSLHDALPIWDRARPLLHRRPGRAAPELRGRARRPQPAAAAALSACGAGPLPVRDRKSTRLNSSHANISYAVFFLKKKIPYTADRPSLINDTS